MRLRRLLWIIPLFLILILTAGIGFVVSTHTGLIWLVSLADRFAPGHIDYERLEGRLIGPLSVDELHYRDDAMAISIAHGEFDWEPSALLSATARINRLKVSGIEVHLPEGAPPPEEPTEPFALPEIRLPLQVDLQDIDITDVRIYPAAAEQPIIVDRLHLQAQTEDQTVILETFLIRLPEGRLQADGRLEPTGDYPLTMNVDWKYEIPELGSLAGQGKITGDLQQTLFLTHSVSGAINAQLQAQLRDVLETPAWSARLKLSIADLARLNPELMDAGLTAELTTEGSLSDFKAAGQLATTLPQTGPVEAEFRVSGSTRILHINRLMVRTREGPMKFTAQADINLADLHIDARGQWENLAWPLTGQPQIESPSGELSVEGTLQDYRLALKAGLTSVELGKLNTQIKATGTDQAIRISEITARSVDDPLALTAQGELTFADLSFKASGQWQNLAWPLTGEPQVESPEGSFQAQGSIKDYQFTLETQVQGPNVPPGNWRLEGQGSDQALERATLQGEVLEGEVRARLSARWQPRINWQTELSARGINPGAHWPDLSGNLSLMARSQGSLTEQGLQTTLNLDDLSGTLNEQTVEGKAQLALDGQDLTIDTLQVTAGAARLNASGTLQQRWDIRWQLQVPDLALLAPNAAGSINSSGTIQGPRDQPQADLTVSGDGLTFLDNRIERLRGQAQVDLSGESRSRIELTASDMELAGQSWQQLSLEGSGTPENHNLQTALTGDPGRFEVALEGGLSNTLWQGRLNRLSAQGDVFGNWSLEQPASLVAGAEQASLQQACLSSAPARLCIQGQWDQQTGANGRLTLAELPLARFQEFLPPGAEIDTRLNANISGSSQPDGTLQGSLDLGLTPGSLRLVTISPPLEIPLREAGLQAQIEAGDATGQLRVDLGDIGQIRGDVEVQDLQNDPRLAGTIRAELTDLGLVSGFTPQIQNLSGQLVADLELGGTPTAVQISGEARLEDASADIPPAGIRVQDIQLAAASDGQGPLEITGSARSGPGRLELAGQLDPTSGQIDLNIKGKEFQAADTQEIQALISPDLDVHFEPGLIRVEGQVTIPQAYLSPPGGADGGVSPSQDVVIVSTAEEDQQQVQGFRVFTRVRVILGKDVQVEAGGFKGNIEGNLLVEQTPRLAPRGTGTIQVQTGQYRVYGQELEIQRGRILFAGGPIDNPGLDLRVAREVDDVTAGARVGGTVKAPELSLFSEPAMSDSSILSYLLFGRPPEARAGSENELLFKAALALGLSGGNLVTQRLTDAFGLDYFRFETGDEPTEAALIIGKYLSPNLYVSYGIGIFEAVNTFNLRYDITEQLSIESTTTGETSGADLIFTIER